MSICSVRSCPASGVAVKAIEPGVVWHQLLLGDFTRGPGADWRETLQERKVPENHIALLGECLRSDASRRPQSGSETMKGINRVLMNLDEAERIAKAKAEEARIAAEGRRRKDAEAAEVADRIAKKQYACVQENERKKREEEARQRWEVARILLLSPILGFFAFILWPLTAIALAIWRYQVKKDWTAWLVFFLAAAPGAAVADSAPPHSKLPALFAFGLFGAFVGTCGGFYAVSQRK